MRERQMKKDWEEREKEADRDREMEGEKGREGEILLPIE